MKLRAFRGCLLAALALTCWLCAGVDVAFAQRDPLQLTVEGPFVGLGGNARAGAWNPVKMHVANQSASPRAVICQCEVNDPDGDVVMMRREATLSPGRSQDVWVYARPPLGTDLGVGWRFSVVDRDSGAMLARTITAPVHAIDEGALAGHGVRVIGVSGSVPLGLKELADDFDEQGQSLHAMNYGMITQHEPNRYLQNLRPQALPDRWYGMSMMQAYIWTPEEGGDPGASDISADTIKAIHEWVRRGGHLVMILPAVEDWWTQSPLADMLPGVEVVSRSQVKMPLWIAGAIVPPMPDGSAPRLEVKQLKLKDGVEQHVTVLCRDDLGAPLAVAGRYGFGRVTLVGVDVTASQVIRLGVPSGKTTMWQSIFNWRGETHRASELDELDKLQRVYRPGNRQALFGDGEMIDGQINMRETVGPLLMGAAVLFAVYWALACPGSWYLLRKRGMERHSWVVFAGIACAFVAIAWIGALFTRPATARLAHYSVVDLDARTSQARVVSWATVFVPTHGKVRLDVEADDQATPNGASGILSAIGSLDIKNKSESTFLDSQIYELDASLPSSVSVPFRGTAKRVQLDWRGPVGSLAWPAGQATTAPTTAPVVTGRGIQGTITRRGESLRGRLAHDLPGVLEDVRVIYPAENGEPWVARLNAWRPGEVIDLDAVTNALDESRKLARQRLAIPLNSGENWAGYLGDLMKYAAGTTVDPNTGAKVEVAASTLAQQAELLSFFDNLPPPRSIAGEPIKSLDVEKGFVRGPGRVMDMSQALGLKRVIILGHIVGAPMPAPLHVDGKSLPGGGWTLVRWVGEVESAK